jgi:hypothetical protein
MPIKDGFRSPSGKLPVLGVVIPILGNGPGGIDPHGSKYISQFGPGWYNYKPSPSETELKEMKEMTRKRVGVRDGKAFEGFR